MRPPTLSLLSRMRWLILFADSILDEAIPDMPAPITMTSYVLLSI